MTEAQLDRELSRLHTRGDREAVVTLMRKYGLIRGQETVREYLSREQVSA